MRMNKELENVFRKQYHKNVLNLQIRLLKHCENVIEACYEHGDLESFSCKGHFEKFAVEALLFKIKKIHADEKGMQDLIYNVEEILYKDDASSD